MPVADFVEFPLVYGFMALYCFSMSWIFGQIGGFAFKTIVLQHYWELEAHINTRKTSDGGPKRLQTVFETDANKYFFRGVTTVKVIVDGHGSNYNYSIQMCNSIGLGGENTVFSGFQSLTVGS